MSGQTYFDSTPANPPSEYQQSISEIVGQNAKRISLTLEGFSAAYNEAALPERLRYYTQVIVGVAAGRLDWFTCTDRELAPRMYYGDVERLTMKGLISRCQRRRSQYIKWQNASRLQFIEFKITPAKYIRNHKGRIILNPDGSKKFDTEPTQYRVPILGRVSELINEAEMRHNPAEFLGHRITELVRFTPEEKPPEAVDLNSKVEADEKVVWRWMSRIMKRIEKSSVDPEQYLEHFYDRAFNKFILLRGEDEDGEEKVY